MENKKQLLEKLRKRNEELKLIVFVGFNTEKELLNYRKKIQKERDEYFNNLEQIQQLEHELMTPEERAREEEVIRLMKLKREGKME